MRRVVMGLAAVGSLVSLLVGLALAQAKKPDASLTLSEGTVAVGIGFSWGKGTLAYQGKDYPVKVTGLSVGEVGVNRATALGSVYNLTKLADFDGNYVAGGAGATIGGGAGITPCIAPAARAKARSAQRPTRRTTKLVGQCRTS